MWPNCGVRWRITISRRHAERRQRVALERVAGRSSASPARCSFMSTSARGQVLDGVEALVEVRGLLDLRRPAPPGSACRSGSAARTGSAPRASSSQCSRSCDGNSTKSRATFVPGERRIGHVRVRPCSAWPNSWNSVVASSQLIRTGSPGLPFTKFALFETIVVIVAVEALLGAVRVHPRARALAGARVGIEVPEADVLAGRRPSPPDAARRGGRPARR